ncbi:hypothetical protein MFLO_16005 [Listeria floridensis FSL S10-1187]|uniref:Phage protein n=1 Tax=Listeria floridensis FSL S10-1187 TaxID=1265817 RepID=A0ABN0RB25_9LIST|nr:hypothetical protein [Listeria floridensis]EUJ23366.1 hypothetical protein MFLO_16005 [Listeria floridensis FSL S10-1187]
MNFTIVLFVITLIPFIATVGLAMHIEKRVSEMMDEKYIEIVKPMLSIGDLVAINNSFDGKRYSLGIVSGVHSDFITYINERGVKDEIYIKQITKIYCSKDLSAEWKARVKRNFENDMRRVMEEDTE